MKKTAADRILEMYRSRPPISTRKTYAGHRVDWDEGDTRQDDEIADRLNRLKQQQLALKQKKLNQERLKNKNKVPIKGGKPMFENMLLDEDLNKAIYLLRQYYYSAKSMRFREWCDVMEKLFDELD